MDPSSSSPKGHRRDESASVVDPRAVERDSLLHRLLDSVKQCQIRFGKKATPGAPSAEPAAVATTTLATESEAQVICLLTNLEAALSHGLKPSPGGGGTASLSLGGIFSSSAVVAENSRQSVASGGRLTFWPFVKSFLGADESARFDGGGVTTDFGRGRAWLRTALNENTLERYFYSLVNDGESIKVFYEPWSFMRDDEKSSVLPSMAAGLRTILFNVKADGQELDHVPKHFAPHPEGGRNILNSIPLGGIIRDSILSSSLPNNQRNKNCSSGTAFSASSLADNDIDIYLNPVIVPPPSAESDSLKLDKNSSSNCDKAAASSSSSASRKSAGKKKKKTVANIVHLDDDLGDQRRHQERSTTSGSVTSSDKAPLPTIELSPPSSSLAHRRRTSDPPSALTLRTVHSTNAVPAPADSVARVKDKPSSSSSEMRFVCSGNSGDIMSPVTPVTPMIPVAKEIAISDNNDYDSSDAVSIKSVGQISETSIASSTTSDLSTSANFLSGNGIAGIAYSNANHLASPHPQPHPQPHPAPTLLSLRKERLGEETPHAGGGGSASSSSANLGALSTTSSNGTDEDFDSLSADELRVAIVSIMQSKDRMAAALEDARLRGEEALGEVTHLQQENATLRDAVVKSDKKVAEAEANAVAKSKFLQRENQLLKHQLKKYVGTVQSLQRRQTGVTDGSPGGVMAVTIDNLNIGDEAGSDGDTSGSVTVVDDVDALRESYEQKLIQVSEMHSELMEFNDQLVMQLKQKDRLLEGLRTELEDLRGPLPLDYGADNADTLSLASEVDDMVSCASSVNPIPSSLSSCSFRALVNIWIPSAFLQTSNKDTFHVYQVYVRIRDEEWNVYRRYAQFYELHKSKKKQFTDITTIPFPPKKALGNKDEQFVEDRRVKLQQYLRQLLNYLTQCTGYELAHAHPITKERLLSALPFFSDRGSTAPESGTNTSGRFVSSISRGRLCTAEEPTTPQYMGL